jgi:Flp pilus assembly pilin Flp
MRYVVATFVVGLAIGLVLKYTGGGELVGYAMLLTLVALPLLGFIVTIDDDLPGGFSNPDGKARGPWREWENWADLAARGACSGVGFAIDNGWNTPSAVLPWAVGVGGIVASVFVHRRIRRQVVAHGG